MVSKETYVNATYTLTWPGHPTTSGGLRIRGRGDSSWDMWHPDWPLLTNGAYPPKKPYRLNFDVATAPLGLSATQRNWALLADYYDTSKIKNPFAFTLAQRMSGLHWSAEFRHVEVTLNGNYIGLYLLTDLVRVESGRIDFPKASGSSGLALTGLYLFELTVNVDGVGWSNDPGFITSRGMPVAYDDPDGQNTAQAAYLQSFMEEFEDRLYSADWLSPTTGYKPLIDLLSFADWYWINELIMQTETLNPKSVKMYKTRDTADTPGKIYCSSPWDHDLTFGADWPNDIPIERTRTPQGWIVRTGGFWFPRLIQDPEFAALLVSRWAALKQALVDMGGIAGWFDKFYGGDVGQAILRDRDHWDSIDGGVLTPGNLSLSGERDYAVSWLTDRVAWIDSQMA